jgi:hypothetical protein
VTLETLILVYLACGAATLPLSIVVLRFFVSLSAAKGEAPQVDRVFDRAIDISVFLWIVGGMAFYFCSAHIERRKPCSDQRTNQLTAECRRQLGASIAPLNADSEIAIVFRTAGLQARS